jgi:hypothetical protein
VIVAEQDARLSARIVACKPLIYSDAAAPELDRPPHVRAASGIARVGDALYVVQDDAAFIAVMRGGRIDHVTLPPGPNGRRRFEKALGNKLDKLDLEACVEVEGRLVAIGSGSLPVRERFAIVERGAVTIFDGAPLYARLRREFGVSLNLEGACVIGGTLRLFQRGNGDARGDAMNATIDLSLTAFARWIDHDSNEPAIHEIVRYDLGREDGVAYGFTDATIFRDRVLFAAGAEDSPDAIEDGDVLGARVGVMDERGARWASVIDLDGAASRRKIEGIVSADDRILAVVDADDPDRPAELCEIALEGPW